MTRNHFDVLGLTPGVTEDEIKKAYRKLAKLWHPDKNNALGAEEKFKEISSSYEYLINQDRREILERDLRKKSEPKKSSTPPTYQFWSHNDFKFSASKKPSQPSSSSFTSDSENHTQTNKNKSQSKENKKPGKKKQHWTDSFVNKEKNKSKKSFAFDEPFVDDIFEEDNFNFKNHTKPTFNPKSKFSFAFQSFVDQLDNEFDTFYPGTGFTLNTNPFENGYGLSDSAGLKSNQPKSNKHHKKDVAEENGYSGGLDEEYLFHSPRKSPSNSNRSPGTLYQCNFCYKKFTPTKFIQHELKCGKWKEVDVDVDDDDDDDSDEDDFESYSSYHSLPKSNWQDSHTDLINQIRQAKKLAKMRSFQAQEEITCQYCGMGLSRSLVDKHLILCAKRFAKNQNAASNSHHDGKTKQQRAKEYARRVPQPKVFQTTTNTEDFLSPRKNKENPHLSENLPKSPASSKFQNAEFEINGSRISSKKPGSGCLNCTQKYGKDAKFTCSCGTKNVLF